MRLTFLVEKKQLPKVKLEGGTLSGSVWWVAKISKTSQGSFFLLNSVDRGGGNAVAFIAPIEGIGGRTIHADGRWTHEPNTYIISKFDPKYVDYSQMSRWLHRRRVDLTGIIPCKMIYI